MSILHHSEWALLRWFLRLEYVGRDPHYGGGVPRWRIEVRRDVPLPIESHLLSLVSPCVACGALMSPIRARVAGGLYFAATCEDGLHGPCSKGHAARQEYRDVREALLSGSEPAPAETGLLPF